MKFYAGIGSRKLSASELALCRDIGEYLANLGWTLQTGACTGADQAFANGALHANGKVLLCLPWDSYEKDWVSWARKKKADTLTLNNSHEHAWTSIKDHPAYNKLSQGAKRLHARNYLIVQNTQLVLAWPKKNQWGQLGGTGRGMDIANQMGIELLNLNSLEDRERVLRKLYPKG